MIPDLANSNEGVVGKQINRFIPPDLFYMRIVGEMNDEEGEVINGQHYEIGKDVDGLLFLCDISQMDAVSPQTRKGAVEALKKLAIAGVCVIKAPLKARIFAKLILTATNMFRSDKMPVVFVDSMEDAWAWIEQRRKEYHAAKQ
jgi:hypothetical protein